jgi:hypothetical protein
MSVVPLDEVDYSRKQATTLHYRGLTPGSYELRFRQAGKPRDCRGALTVTITARQASASSAADARAGLMSLYQSEHEEQEEPRTAIRLPLDLSTLKFTGSPTSSSSSARETPLIFSGPVKLDVLESQNVITFTVAENGTLVRFSGEHEGLSVELRRNGASESYGTGVGAGIVRVLEPGEYTAQFTLATAHKRASAALEPPEAWLTIMVASPASRRYYDETWSSATSSRCGSTANFPLALRQQKQGDEHQLYYSYPLIKVSPEILASKPVL